MISPLATVTLLDGRTVDVYDVGTQYTDVAQVMLCGFKDRESNFYPVATFYDSTDSLQSLWVTDDGTEDGGWNATEEVNMTAFNQILAEVAGLIPLYGGPAISTGYNWQLIPVMAKLPSNKKATFDGALKDCLFIVGDDDYQIRVTPLEVVEDSGLEFAVCRDGDSIYPLTYGNVTDRGLNESFDAFEIPVGSVLSFNEDSTIWCRFNEVNVLMTNNAWIAEALGVPHNIM